MRERGLLYNFDTSPALSHQIQRRLDAGQGTSAAVEGKMGSRRIAEPILKSPTVAPSTISSHSTNNASKPQRDKRPRR